MRDLIDRRAAIDAVKAFLHNDDDWFQEAAAAEIKKLPTIEKRKTGEWMPLIEVNEVGEPYQAGAICSECGNVESCEPNYCPMCGADMRGEDDGTDK